MKNLKEVKTRGKVYTPANIVRYILDLSDYSGINILKKHVIDNSCGDGAFLTQVVERYINEALKNNYTKDVIKSDLETFIHGIEIDPTEHNKCLNNVSEIAEKSGLTDIKWDIICGNTLNIDKYDNKMDYVVGNPPYVRIHNLGDKVNDIKKYNFSQNGMTDLFIVFYEIGLRMLNKGGILGYITPSSLFNSLAGKNARKHFIDNKLITKVVDFKHCQFFNATTYTAILILSNTNTSEMVEYYEYDSKTEKLNLADNLEYKDFYINNCFYFSKRANLLFLKDILSNREKTDLIKVKNGFATLQDKFFIGKFNFKKFVIPVVKASTGEKKQCIFPYKDGCLIPFADLQEEPKLAEYFKRNKTNLSKRSLEKKSDWYAFGRSQGINDVFKSKISINPIIKDKDSIKVISCSAGTGVYSGLYILTEIPEEKMREILISNDFINYVKMLCKYKSGGYYTFSSSDLKKYLDYKLKHNSNMQNSKEMCFA